MYNIFNSLYTSLALAECIDSHVCAFFKVICINADKQISLPHKEYISGYKCEEQICLSNVEYLL